MMVDKAEIVAQEKTEEKKGLTKTQKFFLVAGGLVLGVLVFYMVTNANNSERRRKRNRLRHYKPSYRGGFWGTYTDWNERDTPLTDDELDEKIKIKVLPN